MNFEPLRRGAMVCFSIHAQQYSLGWEGSTVDHPLSSVTILWSASGRSRIMAASTGLPSSVVKVLVRFRHNGEEFLSLKNSYLDTVKVYFIHMRI